MLPPLQPAQVHVQGPLPETDEAFPAVHRLVVGMLDSVCAYDEPQAPLMGERAASAGDTIERKPTAKKEARVSVRLII